MTLQTPVFVGQVDTVVVGTSSSDPLWTGLTFSSANQQAAARVANIIAMPSPGYAIAFGQASGGYSGFMEISFSTGVGVGSFDALRWTDAFNGSDFTSGAAGSAAFNFVFDENIVATAWPVSSDSNQKLYHRGFTHDGTFGSLTLATSLGVLSWAAGDADQRFQHEVLTPSTIVWASYEQVDVGTDRYITWVGEATVGTSSTNTSGTSVEPTAAFPALSGNLDGIRTGSVHWVDSSTALIVGSYTDNAVTTDIATATWSGGLSGWTKHNVGASPDDMPGWETKSHTVPGRRYRSDQDTFGTQHISGSWITGGPEMEADTGETLAGISSYSVINGRDGIGFQTFNRNGLTVIEAAVAAAGSLGERRAWDPDTGENIEAWQFIRTGIRRIQANRQAAWFSFTTGALGSYVLYVSDVPEGRRWWLGVAGWGG